MTSHPRPSRRLARASLSLCLLSAAAVGRARADVPSTPASGTPSASAQTSAPSSPAEGVSVSARILAGIARVGPGAATIRREARDLLLANWMVLSRAMRAVPANAGQGVIGFRLFGIRAGSIPAALGLLNGDLLRSINGRPTTTPEEVLAAYGGLRGATAWTLRVHRRGQDVVLSVRVVDEPVSPP